MSGDDLIHTVNDWGIQTIIKDDVDGVSVKTVQDIEPILEANKESLNSGLSGYTPSKAMKKVAEIPLVIAEKWRNELGVDVFNPNHAAAVRRLLNSSDYLYLRTSSGRL